MDEEFDVIEIQLEKDHPCLGRAGAVGEVIKAELGADFAGVNVEERELKDGTVVTVVVLLVAPEVDDNQLEAVTQTVREFTPKGVIEPPMPSQDELRQKVDDIQRQLDELRAVISKK